MTAATGHLIGVEALSKSYPVGFWRRRVRVLSGVSFAVSPNEIVGFLGPNGAGKTTTIKILNGLAFPDSGTVTVLGEAAGKRLGTRRRVGFMPEQPYFYEYLTGGEFLDLCGRLYGMARRDIARRSNELLARVGLEQARRMAIRKYSKGMMQRLGMAQALLHDPELVILDEPMSGLDPVGRTDVRTLIRELKEAGKTVFFSSHIISDVEALCDRVVILDRGRKVAEGVVEELMGRDIRYVEVVFAPVPAAAWIAAAGIRPEDGAARGNAFVLKAADVEDADRWIGRFREAGARVLSCLPVKRSLEDIFMERVNDAAAASPRGRG